MNPDELVSSLTIGLDSEGRRHVSTNVADARDALWLMQSLQLAMNDLMRAGFADVEPPDGVERRSASRPWRGPVNKAASYAPRGHKKSG